MSYSADLIEELKKHEEVISYYQMQKEEITDDLEDPIGF